MPSTPRASRAAPAWCQADGVLLNAQRIADGDGQHRAGLHGRPAWAAKLRFLRGLGDRTGCATVKATGPPRTLTISPQTRLTYRYDASAIGNLDDAWGTLLGKPTWIVGGDAVPAIPDSAWRVGVAAERAGAQVCACRWAMIDTRGLQALKGLAQIPRVRALLADNGKHRIANAAEIGALAGDGRARRRR